MQIAQGRHGNPRFAELHARARGRVQHPCRYYRDYASACLNMDDAASTALLDVSNPDPTPIQWVPTIMDFHFLPDMGRMTGEWFSERRTGSLQDPSVLANERRQFRLCSAPQNSMASIPLRGCGTR
jgi:hypothetical protein